MDERNDVIDTIKGILIILVVWTHICTWGTHFFNFVFSFHMAAFFILSGYLLGFNNYNMCLIDFIKVRVKRYIVVYFKFCLIGAMVHVVLLDFDFLNWEMIKTTLLYMQPDWLYFGAGWFLWALFFGNIGCYLWSRYIDCKNKNKIYIDFFCFFIISLLAINILRVCSYLGIYRLYFKLDSGLMAIVFCIIGFYINKFSMFPTKADIFSWGGILACLLYLAYFYTGNIANCFYVDGYVYIFTGILGFSFIALSSIIINDCDVFKYYFTLVGRKSLPIFALHGIALSGMMSFLQIPVGKNVSILLGLLYTLIVIGVIYCFIYLYNFVKTILKYEC